MDKQQLVKKGSKVIADFKAHSTGKINLWTTTVSLNHYYMITVEAQKRVGTGITTAIVLQLPFADYSLKDYLEILMTLQAKWQVPILFHNFPKKKLNALRAQYGNQVIRDDIVRRYR